MLTEFTFWENHYFHKNNKIAYISLIFLQISLLSGSREASWVLPSGSVLRPAGPVVLGEEVG